MIKRFLLLAALAGGLVFWIHQRQPHDLTLQIDLTSALPGEITEIDVIVRRDGHAVARHDVNYGKAGAPGTLELNVHASPGDAEVETTLVYAARPARRVVSQTRFTRDGVARVSVESTR